MSAFSLCQLRCECFANKPLWAVRSLRSAVSWIVQPLLLRDKSFPEIHVLQLIHSFISQKESR